MAGDWIYKNFTNFDLLYLKCSKRKGTRLSACFWDLLEGWEAAEDCGRRRWLEDMLGFEYCFRVHSTRQNHALGFFVAFCCCVAASTQGGGVRFSQQTLSAL